MSGTCTPFNQACPTCLALNVNRSFRPRLRFSLRTLFVLVTICGALAGYVGWQWRIVQERNATLSLYGIDVDRCVYPSTHQPSVPWIRRLVDDEGFSQIGIADPEALERVRQVFPEAKIRIGYFHEFPGEPVGGH